MSGNDRDAVAEFITCCYEQGELLDSVIRSGSEAIRGMLERVTNPPIHDELFQVAIEATRLDGTANAAARILTELHDSTRGLRNTASDIANWDEAPTTYTVEWNTAKARFNHAIEAAWPWRRPHTAFPTSAPQTTGILSLDDATANEQIQAIQVVRNTATTALSFVAKFRDKHKELHHDDPELSRVVDKHLAYLRETRDSLDKWLTDDRWELVEKAARAERLGPYFIWGNAYELGINAAKVALHKALICDEIDSVEDVDIEGVDMMLVQHQALAMIGDFDVQGAQTRIFAECDAAIRMIEASRQPAEWPTNGHLASPKQTERQSSANGKADALRSWTQPELDAAIEQYKAQRSSDYHRLLNEWGRGSKEANKAARQMFGRNAIAKALRVRARAMVTNSPAYRTIADAFGWTKGTRPTKIGFDAGVAEKAESAGHQTSDSVIRRETIRLIKKQIGSGLQAAEAEALIEQLENGDISDDEVRRILDIKSQDR